MNNEGDWGGGITAMVESEERDTLELILPPSLRRFNFELRTGFAVRQRASRVLRRSRLRGHGPWVGT